MSFPPKKCVWLQELLKKKMQIKEKRTEYIGIPVDARCVELINLLKQDGNLKKKTILCK